MRMDYVYTCKNKVSVPKWFPELLKDILEYLNKNKRKIFHNIPKFIGDDFEKHQIWMQDHSIKFYQGLIHKSGCCCYPSYTVSLLLKYDNSLKLQFTISDEIEIINVKKNDVLQFIKNFIIELNNEEGLIRSLFQIKNIIERSKL